jgi:uncharacterized paraquat-inducible protein A
MSTLLDLQPVSVELAKSRSKEEHMEKEYYAECEVCDIVTHVIVEDYADHPAYCPMCGEDVTFEECED